MNFYQKLSQPAVRAEMAEEWGLAAAQWQKLPTLPAAYPWRMWIRGRISYCRERASSPPRRH
jgi:hypothetical protein